MRGRWHGIQVCDLRREPLDLRVQDVGSDDGAGPVEREQTDTAVGHGQHPVKGLHLYARVYHRDTTITHKAPTAHGGMIGVQYLGGMLINNVQPSHLHLPGDLWRLAPVLTRHPLHGPVCGRQADAKTPGDGGVGQSLGPQLRDLGVGLRIRLPTHGAFPAFPCSRLLRAASDINWTPRRPPLKRAR